jgi:hypothetical protein
MRLIVHAAAQRNLAEWGAGREHEALGELDAATRDPDASRHTESALERTTEVADAKVEGRSKILDEDLAGKIGVDMYRKPSRLPGREASARGLPRTSVAGLHRSSASRMPIQDRNGASDMGFGAVAITLPRAISSLDELSAHNQQVARFWVSGGIPAG